MKKSKKQAKKKKKGNQGTNKKDFPPNRIVLDRCIDDLELLF